MALTSYQAALLEARDQNRLSNRGALGFTQRDVWGPREKSMASPWSPTTNPDGPVIMRLAENSLMHEEVADFIKSEISVTTSEHLTYSTGPRGSRRLRNAAARYMTEEFHSREVITADDLYVTSGLASALDALAWSICDDGEGIMVPRPFYNGFSFDLLDRSNVKVVGVTYDGIEHYSGLDDLFAPAVNKAAFERTLGQSRADGVEVRAVCIANPHNPLGRCYPPETIKEIIEFCGENKLHFISDEIYAKTSFENPDIPEPVPFTSVLSIEHEKLIDPMTIHVIWGASKDFCANGLRLGLVYTKNKGIIGAMSSIGHFSWSPHLVQDVWAAMLENRPWLDNFMQRKCQLMAENYRYASTWLAQRNIRHYSMYAALFIWVDLRHLFLPKEAAKKDYAGPKFTSPNAAKHQAREQAIEQTFQRKGVMIAPGSAYFPEEYGWFRITFTVSIETLKEGLNRFGRALDELRAEL